MGVLQRTQATTEKPPRAGRIPLGILMLLGYLAYTVLTELIHLTNLKTPAHSFGALRLTGLPAIGYSVALIAGLSAAFYGMVNRKVWAREIAIVWFIIAMAAPALDLAGFLLDPEGTMALVRRSVQQYLQDYAHTARLPLDPAALAASLTDKRIILLFLMWDVLVQWAVGVTAIIYLQRQRMFFKA